MQRFPYSILIVMTLLLGLSPLGAEPHLLEKSRMLVNGELRRALDIFDLLFHATPLILLLVKVWGDVARRAPS